MPSLARTGTGAQAMGAQSAHVGQQRCRHGVTYMASCVLDGSERHTWRMPATRSRQTTCTPWLLVAVRQDH